MAKSLSSVCHVEKNIASLAQYPRVALNNIKDFDEAFTKKKRKGRGIGSGRGKTCGRGHKGQGKYGTWPRIGFEGGQTPFYLCVPKHGYKNKNQRIYTPLNLNRLQYFIDSGRIDPSQKIDMHMLWRVGAVTKIKHGVKLLATGSDWFQAKVDIEVSRASKTAIDVIEKQGGKITCAHYNKLGLRVLLKPEKFADRPGGPPRRAQPPKKLMNYYKDPQNRGYLADPEKLEELRKLTLVKHGLPDVDPNITLETITEATDNLKITDDAS